MAAIIPHRFAVGEVRQSWCPSMRCVRRPGWYSSIGSISSNFRCNRLHDMWPEVRRDGIPGGGAAISDGHCVPARSDPRSTHTPESRWPVAAEALEQSMLESKDKEQLVAIAQALGIKTTARAAKATLIDKILETTRPAARRRAGEQRPRPTRPPTSRPCDVEPIDAAVEQTSSEADDDDASTKPARNGRMQRTQRGADQQTPSSKQRTPRRPPQSPSVEAPPAQEQLVGPDGEPLADWEIDLIRSGQVEPEALTTAPATARCHTDGRRRRQRCRRRRRRRRRRRPSGREPQRPPAPAAAQQGRRRQHPDQSDNRFEQRDRPPAAPGRRRRQSPTSSRH